ncbi:TMF family protein [Filimonas effusa]|uniref:Peptidase S74 domain-containing protein n=1 Tax=Filimonas effusa TaxID=2508721 RepID=A0A4Q1D9R4_9BACT|nr:TMF family protein [Filimonas effusa]RXK85950.1 hypothetical protein ESB13_03835 [Filimonas effusa]
MKRILFTLSACLITTFACFSQETLQTVTDRGSSTTNNISITGTGSNYINGRTTADSAWTFKNSVSINSALLGAIGAPALFSSWTWYKPYISGITPSMMVIRKGQTDVNSYLKDGLLLVDTLKWISNVNTSGFNQLQLAPVLNLNGFSGITRGLYVNPVLNNITNFRAIETNVANGQGIQIMANGTAPNYFRGRTTVDSIWVFNDIAYFATQTFATAIKSNSLTYYNPSYGMTIQKSNTVTNFPFTSDALRIFSAGSTNITNTNWNGVGSYDSITVTQDITSASVNQFRVGGKITQTGFSGPVQGINVNTQLVGATNFRAIQTNTNTGAGYQIYAAGTAPSFFKGNLSIGKDTARAVLDVAKYVSNGALGTVLARLYEGDSRADGTFLGVRSWGTQNNEYNGKSFSIEHSFYGALNSAINFYRGSSDKGGYITFATSDGTEKMRIDQNGYVGIGTANPQSALAVKGTITSMSVKVTRTGWADYVFDSSYQLPSLAHVESFINENKHLPEVPSATEVKTNGLDLGDNQVVLLKKIEELTLYIIQQNKQISQQSEQITRQNKEMEQVKKRLEQLETKK